MERDPQGVPGTFHTAGFELTKRAGVQTTRGWEEFFLRNFKVKMQGAFLLRKTTCGQQLGPREA